MGAGILPTTLIHGKLYFLFGKENKYEDSAPGFSDFGGGTDANESYLQTAVREAGEELTGFLGSPKEIKAMLNNRYEINHVDENGTHSMYRMHLFYLPFDAALPRYYNNNQRFIQTHLSPRVIKTSKIFEKAKIQWICIDQLKSMKSQFRPYFVAITEQLMQQQRNIKRFIRTQMNSSLTKNSRRLNKTNKTNKRSRRL